MVTPTRQELGGLMYVASVAVLVVVTLPAYQWKPRVGLFSLSCLIGTLIPLWAVWATWRQGREAARLGLPRPE
jgi:hypothetical protein